MNEKKEASGKSKKSLLSRLGNLCYRKKALCSGVFGGLGGLVAGNTFYIVGERMSREMGEQFAKVCFMGLLLISTSILLSYYKSSKEKEVREIYFLILLVSLVFLYSHGLLVFFLLFL